MTASVRLALFDFDGTLISGNTLHLFVASRAASPRYTPSVLAWSAMRKMRLVGARRFKEGILGTLRGRTVAEVAQVGAELYERKISERIRPPAIRALREHQSGGARVIIVTGAFDFLVTPFCEEFGIDDLLCCRLEVRDGRATGRIAGPEMLGADKPPAVRDLVKNVDVDWGGSTAYSDDLSDLPLLEMAGERFLVGEDAGLDIGEVKSVSWGLEAPGPNRW